MTKRDELFQENADLKAENTRLREALRSVNSYWAVNGDRNNSIREAEDHMAAMAGIARTALEVGK